MKPWSRLCCLVLLLCSSSRGQNGTSVPPGGDSRSAEVEGVNSTASPTPGPTHRHDGGRSSPGPATHSTASRSDVATTTDGDAAVTTSGPPMTTVAMETSITSATPSERRDGSTGQSTWASILLALIAVAIVVLCVILFFLRKASKTYSFELQRPRPSGDLDRNSGTFEPVYRDDLERPDPKVLTSAQQPETPPATNGSHRRPEEPAGNPPELTNGVETQCDGGPISVGADTTADPLSGANPLLNSPEPPQNQNNNNPVGCSDPFVEVSLDESPRSDPLLSSPEAPSSVLPFSPPSF